MIGVNVQVSVLDTVFYDWCECVSDTMTHTLCNNLKHLAVKLY